MKLYEALAFVKENSGKKAVQGNLIFGYAPRFEQFFEEEYSRHVYITSISTRLLFSDGWEVID